MYLYHICKHLCSEFLHSKQTAEPSTYPSPTGHPEAARSGPADAAGTGPNEVDEGGLLIQLELALLILLELVY